MFKILEYCLKYLCNEHGLHCSVIVVLCFQTLDAG